MEIQVPTVEASGHLHPHHLQSLPLPCPSKGLGQARSAEDRAVLTTPGQLGLRYRCPGTGDGGSVHPARFMHWSLTGSSGIPPHPHPT